MNKNILSNSLFVIDYVDNEELLNKILNYKLNYFLNSVTSLLIKKEFEYIKKRVNKDSLFNVDNYYISNNIDLSTNIKKYLIYNVYTILNNYKKDNRLNLSSIKTIINANDLNTLINDSINLDHTKEEVIIYILKNIYIIHLSINYIKSSLFNLITKSINNTINYFEYLINKDTSIYSFETEIDNVLFLKQDNYINFITYYNSVFGYDHKIRYVFSNNYTFSYVPILCTGHCSNLFKIYIDFLNKNNEHIYNKLKTNIIKNIFIIDNKSFNKTINNKEISQLDFLKIAFINSCVFSHNLNEIKYHPLNYKSEFCRNNDCLSSNYLFNKAMDNNTYCTYSHKYSEIENYKYLNIDNFDYKSILNLIEYSGISNYKYIYENNKISNSYNKYSLKSFEFDQNYLDELKLFNVNLDVISFIPYKVIKCNKTKCNIKPNDCFYYHNNLERVRPFNIKYNIICKHAFNNDQSLWIDPIKCKEGSNCNYYHTKNELFYSLRNYRKIYDCSNTEYCKNKENGLCYNKHLGDSDYYKKAIDNIQYRLDLIEDTNNLNIIHKNVYRNCKK